MSFRHQAALLISVFDAPGTASSSLRTVVHAEPASVDRYWRGLISAAVADEVIEPSVDSRILRHVLNRTIAQVGLAWDYTTESDQVTDCILALLFDGLAMLGRATARIGPSLLASWTRPGCAGPSRTRPS